MKILSNHFNYNLDKNTQIRRKWKIRSLPLHPNAHNYNNISIPEFEPMPKQSIIYTSIYFVISIILTCCNQNIISFSCVSRQPLFDLYNYKTDDKNTFGRFVGNKCL